VKNFITTYKIFCLLLILFLCNRCKIFAQQTGKYDTLTVHGYIMPDGEIIPYVILPPVEVVKKLTRKQSRYLAEWNRLRNAVYVTYPYAKASAKIINEINAKLVNVHGKDKRKAIIRSREKELKKEFADKLTQLSVYQGRVLVKLIYRQTNNSCYEIIEEYKGSFNAAFWQTVAVLFGGNLKLNYDAAGADKDLEQIVKDVARMYGDNI
jgi:hypothetical protein